MPVDPILLEQARLKWAEATGATPPGAPPGAVPPAPPGAPPGSAPAPGGGTFDRPAISVAQGERQFGKFDGALAANDIPQPSMPGQAPPSASDADSGPSPTGEIWERTKQNAIQAGKQLWNSSGMPELAGSVAGRPDLLVQGLTKVHKNVTRPLAQATVGEIASWEDARKDKEAKADFDRVRDKQSTQPKTSDASSGEASGMQVPGGALALGISPAQGVDADPNVRAGYGQAMAGAAREGSADARLQEVAGGMHNAMSGAYSNALTDVEKVESDRANLRSKIDSQVNEIQTKKEQAVKEYSDMGAADPFKLFKGVPGAFNAIAAVVGSIAGGIAGGMRGDGQNKFLSVIDNWMDQSMKGQLSELNKKQNQISNLNGLYQDMRQRLGDNESAALATKQAVYQGLQLKLQQLVEKAGADSEDPMVQKAIAHWEQKIGELRTQFGLHNEQLALNNAQLGAAVRAAQLSALKDQSQNLATDSDVKTATENVVRDDVTGQGYIKFNNEDDRKKFSGYSEAWMIGNSIADDIDRLKDASALDVDARSEIWSRLETLMNELRQGEGAGTLDNGVAKNFEGRVQASGVQNIIMNAGDASRISSAVRKLIIDLKNKAIIRARKGEVVEYTNTPLRRGGTAKVPSGRSHPYDMKPTWETNPKNAGARAADTPAPPPDKE